MSTDVVLYEPRGRAAVVTLNRPDRRNALSRELIAALTAAFGRARDDAAVRCVILTGAGHVFCSGMDLGELQESLEAKGDPAPVWDDALRLATTEPMAGYIRPFGLIRSSGAPAIAHPRTIVTAAQDAHKQGWADETRHQHPLGHRLGPRRIASAGPDRAPVLQYLRGQRPKGERYQCSEPSWTFGRFWNASDRNCYASTRPR